MSKKTDFIHLHVHSDFSLLDGACRVDALAEAAVRHGMPALALTDHGNLFGVIQFYNAMKEAGVKPIIGYEAYVAPGSRTERDASSAKDAMSHLTLLATDERGYHNLIKLSSSAYLDGFYYRPRIDKQLLSEHADGLICLSGCNSGEICRHLLQGDADAARRTGAWYRDLFGKDRFYIEIQDNNLPNQRAVLPGLLEVAEALELGMVATNDTHYLTRDDAEAHEALLCINTGRTLSDANRLSLQTDEFYFRSPDDMARRFRAFPGAVENTVAIAARCDLKLNFDERHFPRFRTDDGEAPEALLRRLCHEGAKRLGFTGEAATQRLEYELDIIARMGFASYFLIVWDVVHFARRHKIPQGLRGSAVSSSVVYTLGLSNINPLTYELVFERFLDPERKEAPDIDIDLCEIGREQVINYVRQRFGEQNTAQIITFGTMAAKAVVRDVGRVMGISLAEVDAIAKKIPATLGIKLKEALEQEADLRTMRDGDARLAKLFDIAMRLEGLNRHAGTHAAGMVIADEPLDNLIPLYRANDVVSSQYAMGDLEKVGMLKMDLLGLRTLTVVDQTLKLIEEREGRRIDLETLALDDEATYDLLCTGETSSIFQLGSDGIQQVLRDVRPRCLEDLIAIIALYRPGPLQSGVVDQFIARRHGRERVAFRHPTLEPILKGTSGLMVYQEQIMRIGNVCGGMSLGKALTLIKAISKKKKSVIEAMRPGFIDGCVKNGFRRELAAEIFNDIEKFAQYGFNKSHTTAYAFLSYHTAYLKAHYPVEFVAAGMTCDMQFTDKIVRHIAECRSMGIAVHPPSINHSEAHFTVEGEKGIRFGLGAIRNVGINAARAIAEARRRAGGFRSLSHFCEEVDSRTINKTAIENLIKAGALDDLPGHRAQFLDGLEEAMRNAGRVQQDRRLGQATFFGQIHDDGETEAALPSVKEWSEEEKRDAEEEALGIFNWTEEERRLLRELSTVNSESIHKCHDSADVVIGGRITKLRPTVTKRGQPMAHVEMADPHGVFRAVMFPDVYEKHGGPLREKAIVFLIGTADVRTQRPCVIINDVVPIEEAAARLCQGVEVEVANGSVQGDVFDRLRAVFDANSGPCPVTVRLCLDDGKRVALRVGRSLSVRYSDRLRREIDALLGEGRLHLVGGPQRSSPQQNGRRGRRAAGQ